jgi:gliding motility-associated-like protein
VENVKGRIAIIALLGFGIIQGQAQCPEFYGFFGVPSANPSWFSCSGNNYTLNLQSPDNIGPYTVDWGDGSPITSGAALNPPGSVSHFYSATIDTYTITFTETSTGCVVTGTLVMEEATSASIQIPMGGLTQACAPQDMEFTNSSTNVSPNTVFEWDFGDGSPNETYDYTNWNQTITHTYQENTVDCETVVTLTAGNQCNSIQGGNSTATFNPIRIWDYDDAGITPSDYVLCWPENTVTYLNTTEMNCFFQGNIAQRYEYWNLGDYWGTGTDSIIGWTPWPPTFPQTVSYPGIGNYTVMLLDSNFCGIDTAFVTISIVPPPTAGITADKDTICAGETVTFFNTSSPEANAWLINFGTGAGWQGTTSLSGTHTFNTPGDYEIALVAYVSGAGATCTDTAYVYVHVQPGPLASFSLSDDEACDSLTLSVTESSVSAISWNWNMGNGNTYTIQSPPDQTYLTPGIHPITLMVEAANGCIDQTQQQVQVNPSPIADFSALDVCLGDTAQFIDQSTTSFGQPLVSWSWDFGDGTTDNLQNPVHYYGSGGFYDVLFEVSTANCSDDTLIQINVENPPTSAFTADVVEGCSPLAVSFTNASSGAVSYLWNFGDGNISTDTNAVHVFSNTTINSVVYSVELTSVNAFGCSNTTSMDVTVYGQTVAAFTSNASPACAPYEVQFNNTSSGASGFEWNFGDGSPVTNAISPSHLFSNNTDFIQYYETMLVAFSSNGCHDTTYQTITSYPDPDFTFNISAQSGCTPLTVNFPTIAGAVTYQWNFGDGVTASGAAPSHIYQNLSDTTQTYQVRLIASNPFGCVDTSYSTVSVFPKPIAQFTAAPNTGCSPLEVQIENSSTLAFESRWIYGTGDTLFINDAIHSYTYYNTGATALNRTIRLRVTTENGCRATATAPVTIYPEVSASFTNLTQGCSPLSVPFDNTSVGGTDFIWAFGDGTVSFDEEPVKVFNNSTSSTLTMNVQMIASNSFGCRDTAYSTVQVFPRPIAQFTAFPSTGCSPMDVTLNNTSILAANSQWIYGTGDTSIVNMPSHTFTYVNDGNSPDAYNLRLIVTSAEGCVSSFTQPINVYPEVHTQFSMNEEGCSPLLVQFENMTTGANSHLWSFGDGFMDVTSEPDHTYFNPSLMDSLFIVQLTSTSIYGCTDTYEDTVLVHPRPIADFAVNMTQGCSPFTVNITDFSQIGVEYIWTYGDGTMSDTSATSHDHTYVSSSNMPLELDLILNLETEYGCTAQDMIELTVFPEVNAQFVSEEALCAGSAFTFFNQTQGASTYQWNFGDGEASAFVNPLHAYDNVSGQSQSYLVSLLASSSFGCTDMYEDSVTVFSAPIADIAIDSSSVCYPLYIEFSNSSQYADAYNWNYGDGAVSSTADSIHSHVFTNTTSFLIEYDITMIASTTLGCTDTAMTSVQVIPNLEADFEWVDDGCHPLPVNFENQSEGALGYQWIFSDGAIDTIMDPEHTFYNYGITDEVFSITLVASSYFGCADTISQEITVFPLPNAEFVVTPVIQVFPDATVEILDNSVAGTATYSWDFGDGNLADTAGVNSHTYETWGTYQISLLIDNGHCFDQVVQNIEILAPPPVADFDGGGNGCAPVTIAFENLSLYGTNYLWNFGDGGVSMNQEPVYTYYIPGTYTVSLLVTGPGGNEIAVHDTVVHVYPNSTAYFTANPEVVNTGDPVYFYNLSNQADEFTWIFGDGNTSNETSPIHVYQSVGTFDVTLIANNEYNCPDTLTVDDAVLVDIGGYIGFPNAFTPDPTGSSGGAYDPTRLNNDVFFPVFAGVEEFQLQIYNRWGELLFESQDVNVGWDGYYRGQMAQQGVYVWRAQVTFTDGKQVIRAGDLTLLR